MASPAPIIKLQTDDRLAIVVKQTTIEDWTGRVFTLDVFGAGDHTTPIISVSALAYSHPGDDPAIGIVAHLEATDADMLLIPRGLETGFTEYSWRLTVTPSGGEESTITWGVLRIGEWPFGYGCNSISVSSCQAAIQIATCGPTVYSLWGQLTGDLDNQADLIARLLEYVRKDDPTINAHRLHYTVRPKVDMVRGNIVRPDGVTGDDVTKVSLADNAIGPGIGVLEEDTLADTYGTAMVSGILTDYPTSIWAAGTLLYTNGGGQFTSTRPTVGFAQPIAIVLRSHASNGVILVNATYPLQDADDVQFTPGVSVYDAIVAARFDRVNNVGAIANGATATANVSTHEVTVGSVAAEYSITLSASNWPVSGSASHLFQITLGGAATIAVPGTLQGQAINTTTAGTLSIAIWSHNGGVTIYHAGIRSA